MDFDRGPIELITEAQFPRPGERSNFAGLAGELAGQLGAHEAAIAIAHGTMGSDLASSPEIAGASELGDAAAEHDRQSGAIDSSIGDVAAGAASLEGEIPGLTNELGSNLGIPEARGVPPGLDEQLRDSIGAEGGPTVDPDNKPPLPPLTDAFSREVHALYQELLGRDASEDEVDAHRGNPGGIAGVRDTILASGEYLERQQNGG